MLKIINYSKAYRKDQYAVKNLNLEVEAGDLFAFIGHNGAGKSTTIKSRILMLEKSALKHCPNVSPIAVISIILSVGYNE